MCRPARKTAGNSGSGQGMPRLRAPETRGDLYVKLEAQLPNQLSARERELIEELRGLRQ